MTLHHFASPAFVLQLPLIKIISISLAHAGTGIYSQNVCFTIFFT